MPYILSQVFIIKIFKKPLLLPTKCSFFLKSKLYRDLKNIFNYL